MTRKNSATSRRRITRSTNRRRFLKATAGSAAAAWMGGWPWQALMAAQGAVADQDGWSAGRVRHILPGVSDSRMMIKTSFDRPLSDRPILRLQATGSVKRIDGRMNDTAGEFWQFYVDDLAPYTRYELSLLDAGGNSLCDSWPLTTFPAPRPECGTIATVVLYLRRWPRRKLQRHW